MIRKSSLIRPIILNLGDKIHREVLKEESTTVVWLKLELLYMTKSLENHLYLKQKLYSFRLSLWRLIEDYIDDFHKLILDLNNIKVKVIDKEIEISSFWLGWGGGGIDCLLFNNMAVLSIIV